jgi:molecular chaperone GrpE
MPEDKKHHHKEEPRQPDGLAEMKDKYLRAAAELENMRKRAATDTENAARARAMTVAKEFLALTDAIDKAAELSPDDDGIKILKNASESALLKVGITRIETKGQLNPQFHNAISAEKSDAPANSIIREVQAGFMFGDTVLRAAMVIVSKGSE